MNIEQAINKVKEIYDILKEDKQVALDMVLASTGANVTHCKDCPKREVCEFSNIINEDTYVDMCPAYAKYNN